MKMGTIRSPCSYDGAGGPALHLANLRRPATLRYASWAAVFQISQGGGYLSDSARRVGRIAFITPPAAEADQRTGDLP